MLDMTRPLVSCWLLCIWLVASLTVDDDDDDESKLCSPALTARNSHERAVDTLW